MRGRDSDFFRSASEPLAMMNAIEHEIWATDANVALTLTGTLEGYISQFSYAGPRFGFFPICKRTAGDDERDRARNLGDGCECGVDTDRDAGRLHQPVFVCGAAIRIFSDLQANRWR